MVDFLDERTFIWILREASRCNDNNQDRDFVARDLHLNLLMRHLTFGKQVSEPSFPTCPVQMIEKDELTPQRTACRGLVKRCLGEQSGHQGGGRGPGRGSRRPADVG